MSHTSEHQKRLDKEAKLLALTNKFLEEFLKMSSEGEERDDLYHFNFTLAQTIAKSNYPKYKQLDTCLLGMSSFDTEIAKAFFQNKIQGFSKTIGDLIESGRNDDDYRIENLKTVKGSTEVDDFDWDYVDGKVANFKINKKTVGIETTTFNLSNSRNLFKGEVKIFKKERDVVVIEDGKEVVKENVMSLDEIFFYNSSKELILTIGFDSDGREKGDIKHFKHIADINSFFILLNCI